MWVMFISSVLLAALFLYLPGLLFLRAFRLPGLTSVVCAPLISIPAYIAMCLLYAKSGVFSSWVTLSFPLLLTSAIVFAVGSWVGCGKTIRVGVRFSPDAQPRLSGGSWWLSDWAGLGLYVLVGLVVGGVCFVGTLQGPDSFVQAYDNIHHLGTTNGFVASGNWSPFSATLYATTSDAAINPLPGSGFYPTVWNCMAALLVSALGVSAMLAANAVNFLFVAVVLPASMFILMRVLFPKSPGIVAFGSLCVLGLSAFPWMLLLFGPLYPNVISLCLVPLLLFCFLSIFSQGVGKVSRVVSIVLFCVGVLCCAFTQPNAVFTTGVLLIPFCVRQAVRAVDFLTLSGSRKRIAQLGMGIAACLCIALIWYALFKAPFLQAVVSHSWPAEFSKLQAFTDALLLGFRAGGTQIALAILVVAGGLYTLRHREHLWITCSYAIVAAMYVVGASSDGFLQHLLTGFWYTDSFRVAASSSLFAIPLASIGLWVVFRAICRLAGRMLSDMKVREISTVSGCAVVAVFLLITFGPSVVKMDERPEEDALDAVLSALRWENDTNESHVYDAKEREFVQEVKQMVSTDDLILNVPDDGSAFAYAADGLRTYYRYLRTYGDEDETEASKIIRNHLVDIASDERVHDAVANVGSTYLLMLDQGDSRFYSPHLFTYEDGKNWRGIEAIDDTTPGFEVILSKDDMRLYRITG